MTEGHENRKRVGLVSRSSATLCRPPVRAGIRVLGMKNMIVKANYRLRFGQNRFTGIQFVKSSIGSVGWMNILAGNEDERQWRFRLFFLNAIRTYPHLGENRRVKWWDEGNWTDGVSVD